MANAALENLSFESRIYEPTKEFAASANAQKSMYEEAKEDRLKFWEKQANRLTWGTTWTKTLDWSNAPFAKWFIEGKLNVSITVWIDMLNKDMATKSPFILKANLETLDQLLINNFKMKFVKQLMH